MLICSFKSSQHFINFIIQISKKSIAFSINGNCSHKNGFTIDLSGRVSKLTLFEDFHGIVEYANLYVGSLANYNEKTCDTNIIFTVSSETAIKDEMYECTKLNIRSRKTLVGPITITQNNKKNRLNKLGGMTTILPYLELMKACKQQKCFNFFLSLTAECYFLKGEYDAIDNNTDWKNFFLIIPLMIKELRSEIINDETFERLHEVCDSVFESCEGSNENKNFQFIPYLLWMLYESAEYFINAVDSIRDKYWMLLREMFMRNRAYGSIIKSGIIQKIDILTFTNCMSISNMLELVVFY